MTGFTSCSTRPVLAGTGSAENWMTKPFFETLDQDYIAQRIDNLLRRIADPATPE